MCIVRPIGVYLFVARAADKETGREKQKHFPRLARDFSKSYLLINLDCLPSLLVSAARSTIVPARNLVCSCPTFVENIYL